MGKSNGRQMLNDSKSSLGLSLGELKKDNLHDLRGSLKKDKNLSRLNLSKLILEFLSFCMHCVTLLNDESETTNTINKSILDFFL